MHFRQAPALFSPANSFIVASTAGVMPTLVYANGYRRVAYGNGAFVAVGSNSSFLATSPDGLNWTQVNMSLAAWMDVAFGLGTFVTCAINSSTIYKSTDGVNWTTSTTPAAFRTVGAGPSLFVGVAGATVYTSPDTITWTARTGSAAATWSYVAYGNGVFVVTGGATTILHSSDGITWTTTVVAGGAWGSVAFGNGMFIAQAATGPTAQSTDGVNWTVVAGVANSARLAYGPSGWVATGPYTTPTTSFATSADGQIWKTATSLPNLRWADVVYGDGKYVFISTLGTSSVITF